MAGDPGRTFDSQVWIGGSGFLVGLAPGAAQAWNATGAATITRSSIIGIRGKSAERQSSTMVINLPTVYRGPESETLRGFVPNNQRCLCAIFDVVKKMFRVHEVVVTGRASQGPTTDNLIETIALPGRGLYWVGAWQAYAVAEFEFTNSKKSATLANVPTGAEMFAVVTRIASNFSGKITAFGQDSETFTAPGIYKIGGAKAANGGDAIAVDIDAAAEEVDFFLLSGQRAAA